MSLQTIQDNFVADLLLAWDCERDDRATPVVAALRAGGADRIAGLEAALGVFEKQSPRSITCGVCRLALAALYATEGRLARGLVEASLARDALTTMLPIEHPLNAMANELSNSFADTGIAPNPAISAAEADALDAPFVSQRINDAPNILRA